MAQALTTTTLPAGIGLEVEGLDLSRPLDDGTVAELRQLFVDAGVLVFRGVGSTPEAHVELSRAFGELERHSNREAWLDGFPELIDISYRPPSDPLFSDLQPVYDVGGVHLAGWLAWHTDQCFVPRLSRGGVLRAIQVPERHGHTGFLDKIRLYDTLDEQLRDRIDDLRVVYRFEPRMDHNRYGVPAHVRLLHSSAGMQSILGRLERDFPPVSHPLVLTQCETGRRVLNFSPCYAVGVEGLPDDEADELLTRLAEHCTTADHAYLHDWQVDDLVAWDNWRMLHNAEGCLETDTRLMHRTSIAGTDDPDDRPDHDHAVSTGLVQPRVDGRRAQ
jgi:taurine dioxygenase